MANLFLTGSGVPTNAVGEVSDYYRDTATNLIYYRAALGWEVVPSLVPTPDGVGTHWYFGNGVPNQGLGEADDYYRDDANGSVYRKHAVNGWEAKGSLDFIGVYGVQWGEGTGAPANIESLNNLPAGSFYLDVATSDIYYKDNTLTWSLKGQLGGGGSGGSSVMVVDNLTSTSTTDALSANQGKVLQDTKAAINSPEFTGTPTAPTPLTADNTTKIATMAAVQAVAAVAGGAAVTTAKGYTDTVAGTTLTSANSYADTLVVGLLDDRGNYNPTATSAYPTEANNGSGAAGAILKGDLWSISADGTMGGIAVTVGDTVRALVDAPAQTASNWAIIQNNIIYVPENVTNKSTDANLGSSDVLYPTQKAVKDYVTANALTNASTRYSVNAQTGTTYTVVAGDVTPTGRVIVKCTNAAAITVTIATPTSLGVSTGDSVNIRQGGTGIVTISGALEGNGVFTAQHETKTLIAQAGNTWLVVGG